MDERQMWLQVERIRAFQCLERCWRAYWHAQEQTERAWSVEGARALLLDDRLDTWTALEVESCKSCGIDIKRLARQVNNFKAAAIRGWQQ